jgi:hypothetical protein
MSTIVTRAGKGSPLTHTEVDNNFTNLNTDKAEDSTVVKLTGDQTIGGTKTFSNTITGSISGNAGTATNGVVTTGSYANPSWITSLDDGKVLPSMSGNSGKFLTTDGTDSSWGTLPLDPSNVAITGGSINGTTIGATTPSTAVVTTLTANTSVSTDTISEKTSATGVTIDGVLLKDNSVSASSGFIQSNTFNSASTFGFRNRIINGAMMIDQRNAGALINPAINGDYYLDRWRAISGAASKFSIGRNAGSVTPPLGFTNYLGITSTSAYIVGADEVFAIRQPIEGFNVADLGWGTANAQTITLSFWVRSSLTGTFGGVLRNSAQNRAYPFTYTINSANTWEYETITIAGDTSGTWTTTNGIGIEVQLAFGAGASVSGTAGAWQASGVQSATGATSVVGTNGATWYITGVQLEKGSTATSFDYRPFGTELQLAQRYYQSVSYPRTFMNISGATDYYAPVYFIVSMRTAPTVTLPSSAGNVVLNSSGTATTPIYQWNAANITTNSFGLRGGTVNIAGIVEGTATASAEL